MSISGHSGGSNAGDKGEYDLMLLLEQLETLEEDMLELDVTTLEEVRQRIAQLHAQLDVDE